MAERTPWVYQATDYVGLRLLVSVDWDLGGTRNILGATVTRDPGCQYHTIVFENPSNVLLRKPLPRMDDDTVEVTLTAAQVRQATGFRTVDDLNAAGQVTAEP